MGIQFFQFIGVRPWKRAMSVSFFSFFLTCTLHYYVMEQCALLLEAFTYWVRLWMVHIICRKWIVFKKKWKNLKVSPFFLFAQSMAVFAPLQKSFLFLAGEYQRCGSIIKMMINVCIFIKKFSIKMQSLIIKGGGGRMDRWTALLIAGQNGHHEVSRQAHFDLCFE